mmetsp:Transcript_11729/g.24663  ORF Transcript_11729/g.24663 Transcript_11729/m.24663 type:complete len:113 (-) Transcript_11729:1331-1669(-)
MRTIPQKVHDSPPHRLSSMQCRDRIVPPGTHQPLQGIDHEIHFPPGNGRDEPSRLGFGGAIGVKSRQGREFSIRVPGDGAVGVREVRMGGIAKEGDEYAGVEDLVGGVERAG